MLHFSKRVCPRGHTLKSLYFFLLFFCEAYYKKHNEGIRHKNILKAIELQLKINGIVKNE
jgi:hypothetical protein